MFAFGSERNPLIEQNRSVRISTLEFYHPPDIREANDSTVVRDGGVEGERTAFFGDDNRIADRTADDFPRAPC